MSYFLSEYFYKMAGFNFPYPFRFLTCFFGGVGNLAISTFLNETVCNNSYIWSIIFNLGVIPSVKICISLWGYLFHHLLDLQGRSQTCVWGVSFHSGSFSFVCDGLAWCLAPRYCLTKLVPLSVFTWTAVVGSCVDSVFVRTWPWLDLRVDPGRLGVGGLKVKMRI